MTNAVSTTQKQIIFSNIILLSVPKMNITIELVQCFLDKRT